MRPARVRLLQFKRVAPSPPRSHHLCTRALTTAIGRSRRLNPLDLTHVPLHDMTTAGAPRALPLDSLSSELRSSIPCTSKWPRESTSQVTPIEALSRLGADKFSVSKASGHHASEIEHDLGVRPNPLVGVQLVVPMSSPWSSRAVVHLHLIRNNASEDLTCWCQPWSTIDITTRTWLGHLSTPPPQPPSYLLSPPPR